MTLIFERVFATEWFKDIISDVNPFGEDKTKSILFSKAKCLKEINIFFAGHSIKQHYKTVDHLM